MVHTLFLALIAIGVVSLAWADVSAYLPMARMTESSGNAGTFAAFASLGVGLIGIVISGISGLISGSVKYVYPDKLPAGASYSW